MKAKEKNIGKILNNQRLRKALAYKSHFWFFHIYLSHYVKYETAPFQRELFRITEDETVKNAVIVAFRGSAKSTIFSLSYPIWSVLGKQQKKFVILLGQTQQQVRLVLSNIKAEFETNDLLRRDFGKLEAQADEWRVNSIVIPVINARIAAFSTGESIRGIRHVIHRPDLIISDDIEDLQSVKTKELRDKAYQWLTGAIKPLGNEKTKLIVVGNLLHEDSLIMRLKESIEREIFDGIFRKYPLINDKGEILWPGRYPDFKAIEKLEKSIGDDSAWHREFLLKIISDEERVVHPEWIHYYDNLPDENIIKPRLIVTGLDPAISEKTSADYTAMVSAYIYGYGKDLRIYILPNPINKRLSFPETLRVVKEVSIRVGQGRRTKIYVEEVAYQAALTQQLITDNYPAEPVKVYGHDKRARLSLTTHLIQTGKILFPKQGARDFILQLIGFGIEKHDDLVDAFTTLILKIIEMDKPSSFGKGCKAGGKPIISLGNIDRVLGHDTDGDIMSMKF